MSLSFRKTHIAYWGIAFFLGLIVSVFRTEIVPKKYYYDSNTYEWQTTFKISDSTSSSSKENTVYFYQLIGLDHEFGVRAVGIISYMVSFFIVLVTVYTLVERSLGRFRIDVNSCLSIIWVIIFSVYISQFTKEFHSIIFTFIAFLARVKFKPAWGIPISWGIILFYSSVFRAYWVILWALLEATQILFYVSQKRKFSIYKVRWLGLFGMLLTTVLALSLYLPEGLSVYRYSFNENRDLLDSASRIPLIMQPGGVISDLANAIYAGSCILLPFYFFAFGSILHKGFILIFFVTIFVLYKKHKDVDFQRSTSLRYSLAILIAFIFTQILFVPDLGSLLRHITPFIPYLLFSLFYNEKFR